MISKVIYHLSNEDYHNSEEYRDYISSTQLKLYARSPKTARYAMDNPEQPTEALRFGTLFHDLMEQLCGDACENFAEVFDNWRETRTTVFEAPVNERTGQAYGSTTKAYKEAYDAFAASAGDKLIASEDNIMAIRAMAEELVLRGGATSVQVRKLLRKGKCEASFFLTDRSGAKLKVRPDMLTNNTIVDWKTITTDDLSVETVNRTIAKHGYDISAAMYQYVIHELTERWLNFFLVFVTKDEPYDCVMVDMRKWAYDYIAEEDVVVPGIGAVRFQALLDQHAYCMAERRWDGAVCRIEPDERGNRIMTPEPPTYEAWRQFDFYNTPN